MSESWLPFSFLRKIDFSENDSKYIKMRILESFGASENINFNLVEIMAIYNKTLLLT